jgi:hypothetical protein
MPQQPTSDKIVPNHTTVTFGCDPELFFSKGGQIIGAEKVIADKLKTPAVSNHTTRNLAGFVLDGVQIELNPRPEPCRANLGNEIAASFRALKQHLAKMDGVTASFEGVVEVSKAELDSLSDKAKVFGCAPSSNAYNKTAIITVDAATYRKRSAGGHIHLGLSSPVKDHPKRLVKILDVILGNTCVMLDRDPNAAERRKVYGKAGEYRTPAHGLEYRTLSNFWLRNNRLFSLVFGLARLSVNVLSSGFPHPYGWYPPWDAEKNLLDRVDLDKVRDAINNNDLALAKENYQAVRAFVVDHVPDYEWGFGRGRMNKFDYFCKMIEKKGIQYWFPEDPMTHWCNLGEGHGIGFESFIDRLVIPKDK